MRRRLAWIGLLGSVEAAISREQNPASSGFVPGVLLAVLVAALEAPLKAEDSKTIPAAAAKTAEAVNIMWRFDGNGRFPNIHPPCEWSAGRNILWKTPVEIGGYSSPIVAGDKVFVTAEMGSLVCLDVADGKILWKKDLFSKDSKDIPADLSKRLMRGCGGESKQSTPTPASNGDLVFYINAMGLCACYDLQGKQKWIRIIETAEDEEHFCSSPIFAGDRIILSWGCLLALNAKDGRTLWKAADAKPTFATPTIAKIGGEAVAVTPAGDIVRLADGEILCSGLFAANYTTPLVEGNALYVIDVKAKRKTASCSMETASGRSCGWRTASRCGAGSAAGPMKPRRGPAAGPGPSAAISIWTIWTAGRSPWWSAIFPGPIPSPKCSGRATRCTKPSRRP